MVHPWGTVPHGPCSGPGLESLSVPDLWLVSPTTHRPTGHVTRNRTGSSPHDLPRPTMTNLGMYDLDLVTLEPRMATMSAFRYS